MFFFSIPRRASVTELAEGQFTGEETERITSLRRQFLSYPDGFAFDVSYRQLEFTRWLIAHGYLSEWNPRGQKMLLHDGSE